MALNTVAASSHHNSKRSSVQPKTLGSRRANFTLLPRELFWIFEIVGLGEDLVYLVLECIAS